MPHARTHDHSLSLFPNKDHDHSDCSSNLMSFAEQYCDKKGLRLTKLRRDILREVAASHKAIGAYQLLDNLAANGKKLAPISVYRSLDFLQEAGLIHRLESTNSYFACQRNFEDDERACTNEPLLFLICDECGTIGEVDGKAIESLIGEVTKETEFAVESSQLEIRGMCRLCQQSEAKGTDEAQHG